MAGDPITWWVTHDSVPARGTRPPGPPPKSPSHHVCGLPTIHGLSTMYLGSPPCILIKGIRYQVFRFIGQIRRIECIGHIRCIGRIMQASSTVFHEFPTVFDGLRRYSNGHRRFSAISKRSSTVFGGIQTVFGGLRRYSMK